MERRWRVHGEGAEECMERGGVHGEGAECMEGRWRGAWRGAGLGGGVVERGGVAVRGRGGGVDRGAGTVWVLAFLGVIWSVGVAAMVVGGVRGARHRVEAAADLGALAGAGRVSEGEGAACRVAREVAADSGGRVASCVVRGRIVEVSVDGVVRLPFGMREVRVVARARAGPVGRDGVP
ncbi:Rv3654c family TadE-like protein [Spirillospora sp. NPDC052269]